MKHAARPAMALLAIVALHAGATPVQVTPSVGANSLGASLSRDGSRLAFYSASNVTGQNADGNFEIHVYDRSTGTTRQVTNDPRGIFSGSQLPSISGDGSRIVFQSFETRNQTGFFRSLYYDVATQQTVALNDYSSAFQLTAISRDGRRIALNVDNQGLNVIDTATGSSGPQLAFNPASFSISGDAQRLATDSFRGGVRFIDVAAGTAVQVSPDGSGFNQRPDLSDDGRTIAFSSTFDPLGLNADHNQELFLYDVASGGYRQVTRTLGAFSMEASLSDDGTRVAFTSTADLLGENADGNQEIYVYDLLQDDFRQLTHTAGSNHYSLNPAISGDGLTVAYSSTGDYVGRNPGQIPQIYLDTLAPRTNDVPEPPTLLLAAAAGAALLRGRRSRRPSCP